MFVDAHCHLSDERVFQHADEVIARARSASVGRLMIGGLDPADWERQRELFKRYPEFIRMSFGIHPWFVEGKSERELSSALQILESKLPAAHALGETGLDFHPKRNPAFFGLQKKAFQAQLELARQFKKPLVLHVVRAHELALKLVKEAHIATPLMLHSFSGSSEEGRTWMKLGATLSFSGGVLVPGKYEKMKAVLKTVPLERLLLETDAPDQGWKEGVNEPSLIPELYQGVAQMLGIELDLLTQKLAENFHAFG